MDKRILKIISVVLMAVTVISSAVYATADDSKAFQNTLEGNYYLSSAESLLGESFYRKNAGILQESIVNYSKMVQCYTSIYDLAIEKDFDEFVAAYKQGKSLSGLIQATNSYYTTVSGEWDVIPGTAEMKKVGDDFIVGTVYESDNGKMFCLPEDKTLNSEIDKQYNIDNTYGTFVIIYGIGCGILLSDGKQESVILLLPAQEIDIKTNTLFSADEFMTQINNLKESIVRPPVEMGVNSDGEINCIVG